MVLAQKIHKISPIARAILVIGAVAALVTGVTFAALTDSATLTGNTIGTASANADLLLWDGDSFEESAPGFNFTELEPGEESEEFNFYFKNDGNTALDVTAQIDTLPTFSSGLDGDDVKLKFYGACDDEPVSATITELNTTPLELPCNPLEEGAQGVVGEDDTNEANYRVTVKIDESVDSSETGEAVGPFDIVFDGDSGLSDDDEPVEGL